MVKSRQRKAYNLYYIEIKAKGSLGYMLQSWKCLSHKTCSIKEQINACINQIITAQFKQSPHGSYVYANIYKHTND